MRTLGLSRLTAAAAATAFALGGCATPYVSDPHVRVAVGERPRLACAANEIQWCADAGSRLECRCAPSPSWR